MVSETKVYSLRCLNNPLGDPVKMFNVERTCSLSFAWFLSFGYFFLPPLSFILKQHSAGRRHPRQCDLAAWLSCVWPRWCCRWRGGGAWMTQKWPLRHVNILPLTFCCAGATFGDYTRAEQGPRSSGEDGGKRSPRPLIGQSRSALQCCVRGREKQGLISSGENVENRSLTTKK